MLLAIDVGNTQTHVGMFQGDELVQHWRFATTRFATADELATIAVPTLVAGGSDDVIAGSGAELASLIKGAQFLEIPRRDHMKAVGDARFKQGVLDFLSKRP